MDAPGKLNASYIQGSLLLAALLGWCLQPWLVFFFALAGLLALASLVSFRRRVGKAVRGEQQ
jgi:hypothetical protein